MTSIHPIRAIEALSTALYDMPVIDPGQSIKLEIYNSGHNLVTTVTYPDKDPSLMCTCQLYFLITALIIIGMIYLLKWVWGKFFNRKSPAGEEGSKTDQTASNEAVNAENKEGNGSQVLKENENDATDGEDKKDDDTVTNENETENENLGNENERKEEEGQNENENKDKEE